MTRRAYERPAVVVSGELDPAYLSAFTGDERREALALAVFGGLTTEQAFAEVARRVLERALDRRVAP